MRAKELREEVVGFIAGSNPDGARNFERLLENRPVGRTCAAEMATLTQVFTSRLARHPVSTLEQQTKLTAAQKNKKQWLETVRDEIVPVTNQLNALSY